MCEFISWIKKGGEVFWLTDAEVFSELGKERLNGCAHNDYLGHGAIRAYWQIDGEQYEVRDFWNLKKLPKRIRRTVESVESFDEHYGRMWKAGYFQNGDLRYIIYHAPEKWKTKASERLLGQKPTKDDLHCIANHAPGKWKKKAQKLLNAQATKGRP